MFLLYTGMKIFYRSENFHFLLFLLSLVSAFYHFFFPPCNFSDIFNSKMELPKPILTRLSILGLIPAYILYIKITSLKNKIMGKKISLQLSKAVSWPVTFNPSLSTAWVAVFMLHNILKQLNKLIQCFGYIRFFYL